MRTLDVAAMVAAAAMGGLMFGYLGALWHTGRLWRRRVVYVACCAAHGLQGQAQQPRPEGLDRCEQCGAVMAWVPLVPV